jgi:aryl-alcohol dehydrogenase-like predicted oxidoreductase
MSSSRRKFIATGVASIAAGNIAVNAEEKNKLTKVDRRQLGKIGAKVSILGLGLGRAFYQPYENNREEGHQLLENALKAGINYWDTAHNYGGGTSELTIAPVVKKHRKDIFLVSKSHDRTYDGFKQHLETSLKRLQTDTIDLFHLHNLKPNDDLKAMEKGAFKAIVEAKEQGIIKNYGVTGHSGAAVLIDAIHRFDPDALLTIFPADRPDAGRYEDELLPLARSKNMGVIGMKTVRRARETDLKGSDLIVPRPRIHINIRHDKSRNNLVIFFCDNSCDRAVDE